MHLYRFRVVHPSSELVAQHEHECSSDAAAVTKARTFCVGQNVEVWEGSRWVTTIKGNSAKPAGATSILDTAVKTLAS